ncbi:sensor histidine kinase [Larkinella sp. VNQ87]|uniref:sensor histidine kinase n=1 Tax=Larkinella sp. VNQ87 TaxID=3400921 RepID=UPI003C07BF48
MLNQQTEKIAYADSVHRVAKQKDDYRLLAESYYLYGKIYNAAGDFLTAQRWLLNSLRVLEPHGDSFELGRLYHRLYITETQQSHTKEARRFALLSLGVFQRISSQNGLIRAYLALADLHTTDPVLAKTRTSKTDSTLYYLNKAQHIAHQLYDPLAIATVNTALGTYLWQTQKSPQAKPYLDTALAIQTRLENRPDQINLLLNLASIHVIQKKPDLAKEMVKQADDLYKRFQVTEYIQHRYLQQNYIAYYTTIGDWKKAFEHAQKAHDLELSAILADRQGAIARLEVEYQTQKKEHQLKAQKQEISLRKAALQTQEYLTITLATLALVAVGASFLFFKLSRKNQRISLKNEELIKEQNHRVKNNLQVVSSLLQMQSRRLSDPAAKKAVAESQLRIQSMAILHQRLYDGDRLAEVNVNTFIRELVEGVLQAYGYLHLHPDFELNAGYLNADKAVPLGLLLNELTTNACKYAFPYTAFPRYSIQCVRTKNSIELTVTDNGPGLSGPEPLVASHADTLLLSRKSSFGMSLIQAQAVQLDAVFRFDSDPAIGGTVFEIKFKV